VRMRPRSPARDRMARTAQDQWGLITRQQALNVGVTSRTIVRLAKDESALRRVAHGVYQLTARRSRIISVSEPPGCSSRLT